MLVVFLFALTHNTAILNDLKLPHSINTKVRALFEDTLEWEITQAPVLVMFTSSSCLPCREFIESTYAELAQQLDGQVRVATIDCIHPRNHDLCVDRFQIQTVPVFMRLHKQEVIKFNEPLRGLEARLHRFALTNLPERKGKRERDTTKTHEQAQPEISTHTLKVLAGFASYAGNFRQNFVILVVCGIIVYVVLVMWIVCNRGFWDKTEENEEIEVIEVDENEEPEEIEETEQRNDEKQRIVETSQGTKEPEEKKRKRPVKHKKKSQ